MRKTKGKGPWWRASEGRWYATIAGKKVRFPADIGEREPGRAWAHYEALKAEGRRRVEEASDPSVETVFQLFLAHLERQAAERRIVPAHYRNRRSQLARFADTDGLGTRRARTLRAEDLEAFVARTSADFSPHYVANCVNGVRAAFNWATRPGSRPGGGKLLEDNPVAGARMEPVGRSPQRFAERPAAAAWLAYLRERTHGRGFKRHPSARKHGVGHAHEQYRQTNTGRLTRNFALLQRVLIRTGARPAELARAEWSEVTWEAGRTPAGHPYAVITLPWQKWKNGRKTRRPRTIYLSAALTRALRREYERPDRHPTHLFFSRFGPWSDGTGLAARVRQLRPGAVARARAMAEAKGRPSPLAESGPGRLVNYLWRHTAASTMLMLGVDLPRIAEALGTSVEMIVRVYGHLLHDHVAGAANVLATGKLPPGPGARP